MSDRIWLWFADNGNIRKWQREPFPEGTEYVVAAQADAEADYASRIRSALVATPPAEQHPDEIAVDCFAAAMKAKLKWEREHRNRSGWQAMSAADLSRLLYEHLPKGDPVDVANLSMMLHQNGQQIETPPAEPVVEALRSEADTAYCRFIDKMSAPLCLGVEHKLETGKFGAAELNAHVDARELYGFHRGINHALAALATKPAVKDDETVVDAPYGWVYFNEDTGTEWSESHPVTSGEVPDATEIRPCSENEKPWIDELRLRDDQLFHLRPLVEAARTFLASPNIVKLTVNGKRMTPQEVAAALAAKEGQNG